MKSKPKEYLKHPYTDGRLIYAFSYLDLVTTDRVIDYMITQYENNVEIEEIAKEVKRSPDEVFLLLLDQVLRGNKNIKRPFAYRVVSSDREDFPTDIGNLSGEE